MTDRKMKSTVLVALLAAIASPATAQPLDPPRYLNDESYGERPWPRPHHLPSWERTQRGYLPSYQFELERRKLCGNFCDDVTRHRRDPFER